MSLHGSTRRLSFDATTSKSSLQYPQVVVVSADLAFFDCGSSPPAGDSPSRFAPRWPPALAEDDDAAAAAGAFADMMRMMDGGIDGVDGDRGCDTGTRERISDARVSARISVVVSRSHHHSSCMRASVVRMIVSHFGRWVTRRRPRPISTSTRTMPVAGVGMASFDVLGCFDSLTDTRV
jgi:hypothetical protein